VSLDTVSQSKQGTVWTPDSATSSWTLLLVAVLIVGLLLVGLVTDLGRRHRARTHAVAQAALRHANEDPSRETPGRWQRPCPAGQVAGGQVDGAP